MACNAIGLPNFIRLNHGFRKMFNLAEVIRYFDRKRRSSYVWILVLFISYGIHFFFSFREYTQIVDITNGKIRGFKSESRGGRSYAEFRGIPYAKPPVGELRFQPPKPAESWSDVYIADKGGIECIQIEITFTFRIVGQEDCLYLNVFTPKLLKGKAPESLLPVIVFIHGGGFISGSGKDYSGSYFMDEDVVLVTLNYRLGALGFLMTGDGSARGNQGLKDQLLALKWVQQNIKQFGGDPNRVNLMGESAGATSVHLHLLSPKSRGLFQKATMLSGNAYPYWATAYKPVEQAERLGRTFGCDFNTSIALVDCLRTVDAEKLAASHKPNRFPMVDPIETYGPTLETVIDGDTFMTESPEKLMSENNFAKVPIMAGLNRGEGLVHVARIIQDGDRADRIKNISEWYSMLPRLLVMEDLPQEDMSKLTKFYFSDSENDSFHPTSQLENLNNLFSDRVFHYYHRRFLRDVQRGWGEEVAPLYSYHYTYQGFFSVFRTIMSIPTHKTLPAELHLVFNLLKDFLMEAIFGTKKYESLPSPCHGDEMGLLFDLGYFFTIHPWSRDYPMSVSLVKIILDFTVAENGKKGISFHGKPWPAFQSESLQTTMRLDQINSSRLIEIPSANRLKFWDSLHLDHLF